MAIAKLILVSFALAAVAVYAAPRSELSDSEYQSLFETFKSDFNKTYTSEQEAYKLRVFRDNVDYINHHNKYEAAERGFTLGIGPFADLTNTEYKRTVLGYNALHKRTRNVEMLDETLTADAVDWVAKGAVTPVKNQAQCGSCWAFSTTGGIEGRNFIASGKLVSLSEQELVSCDKTDHGCGGGAMDNGIDFAIKNGLATEDSYKYTSGSGSSGTCDSTKEQAADGLKPGAISKHMDVAQGNEAQLAAAVTAGPVSVAIEADKPIFQHYSSGVLSDSGTDKCGTQLDHGVLAVGFGTDSGKAYWKVKNSWGETWGDKGYIRLAKDVSDKSGMCGIALDPSYPVMSGAPTPPTPPAPPTPPTPPAPPTPPSGKTHYGDPADGCEADEQAVKVQGLSGSFCSPDCASAACPTDVPSGVTAAPQCALQSTTGDKKCALICSPSTDEESLRAGDAMCGKASCQPIQGTGICTYGGGPSPPPPPSGDCSLPTAIECAKSVAQCATQCKSGVPACVACLAGDFATCCPCIKKIDPNLPISCPSVQMPSFMLA